MIKIGRITLGLTVIAIGSVWLVSIWNPELASELSMYWPLVFIVYGLEVMITSFLSKPKKLSIGLLIISLIFAFTASQFLKAESFEWRFVWNFTNLFENGITEQVAHKQARAEATAVTIMVPNGEVEVVRSEQDEVAFMGSALWEARSETPQLTFKQAGNTLSIDDPQLISLQGKLFVPVGIERVTFVSTNGSNLVTDQLNHLSTEIETTNGLVELNSGQQTKIKTVNGEVSVHHVPALQVTTVNGDIHVVGESFENVTLTSQQGDVNVAAQIIEQAEMSTTNGEIELLMPKANASIQAQTVNGEIELFTQEYGNEKNVTIATNPSGTPLRLTTVNGDITAEDQ